MSHGYIVASLQRLSERQFIKILESMDWEAKAHQAIITPTPLGKIQWVMQITPELEAKLQELRDLLSHVDANPAPEKLIELIADQALSKLRKNKPKICEPAAEQLSVKVAERQNCPKSSPYAKHVSNSTKRHVWAEHEGCTYVDGATGKRCGSTYQLEIEHVVPRAHGGTNEAENLTLLCRAHNQFQAWKWGLIA